MPPILVPSSAKCITIQIVLITKLNEREDFILRGFVFWSKQGITCSKLATEAQGKCVNTVQD